MRKLKVFLLLPLLYLSRPLRSEPENPLGARSPRDLVRGDLARFIQLCYRKARNAPRRLLGHSPTAPEIEVIAARADAEARTAAPPTRRRRRSPVAPRVLPQAPRVRPCTT